MELSHRGKTGLAFIVGLWSLAAQFIFNRIIFFYVANSEYVAASIISIHLAGFWLGTVFARRWQLSVASLVSLTVVVTMAAHVIVWQLGAAQIGLPATVVASVICGIFLASLSGALIVTLMQGASDEGRRVIVADSAGSVLGAVLGGFILIPQFGLSVAFTLVLLVQSLVLAWLIFSCRPVTMRRGVLILPAVIALLLCFGTSHRTASEMLMIDGLPVERLAESGDKTKILYSAHSPYGLITVTESEMEKRLLIDNRPLCFTRADNLESLSEWVVGGVPMKALKHVPRDGLKIANIGLGCGVTVAAILSAASEKDRLDIVEINRGMVTAQKIFWPHLPFTPEDPRVEIVIDDGFRFFAERKDEALYDAVIIDTAWMSNMNATHLFSKEMYENVARNLADDGVLAIWSEESSPFSAVSLIMYRTLREVFPHVVADPSSGVTLFYASKNRPDLLNFLPAQAGQVSTWMVEMGMKMPVNRLDDLVMNHHKFTTWGDSTWDRLFLKYGHVNTKAP